MYTCSQCYKKFKYKSEKVRHEQSHSRQFECCICNKKFNFQSALNRHEKQHVRTGNVACNKCGHSFRDDVLLLRHMKYAHDGTHQCGHCASIFYSSTALQTHLRTHQPESERKFRCQYESCKKSFNFSHHLKNHELTHTNTKKYFCNYCGKGFIQKHHLKIHMKTHSAKWFYCEEEGCSRKFLSGSARDKHFETHGISSESPPTISECFALSDIADDQHRLLTIEAEVGSVPVPSNIVIGDEVPQDKQDEIFKDMVHEASMIINNNTCKSVIGQCLVSRTNIGENCLCDEININVSQNMPIARLDAHGAITTTTLRKCHNPFLSIPSDICGVCDCNKNGVQGKGILISPAAPESPAVTLRHNGTIVLEETFDRSIHINRRAQDNFIDAYIPLNSCKAVLGNCIVSGNGTMGEECLCAKMMNDRNINAEEIDELTLVPYTV